MIVDGHHMHAHTGSMRPSASSSASEMGSYGACSLVVGLAAGSAKGVSLCSASSSPVVIRISQQSASCGLRLQDNGLTALPAYVQCSPVCRRQLLQDQQRKLEVVKNGALEAHADPQTGMQTHNVVA